MLNNPNTNCLWGFQCPKCGSYEPFRIEITTMLTVHDNGTSDTENHEWSDTSYCECPKCERFGTVADFYLSENNKPKFEQGLAAIAGANGGQGNE